MKLSLSGGRSLDVTEKTTPDGVVFECLLPSGGAHVRITRVPPLMVTNAIAMDQRFEGIPIPSKKVEGIGEKWLPVRPGQPEYSEWEKQQRATEKLRGEAENVLIFCFGIVGWKLKGEKSWSADPPDGWKLPPRMEILGVKSRASEHGSNGRRADYIQYIVLTTNSDLEAAQMLMYGYDAPILSAEVNAVRDLFRDEESGSEDTAIAG